MFLALVGWNGRRWSFSRLVSNLLYRIITVSPFFNEETYGEGTEVRQYLGILEGSCEVEVAEGLDENILSDVSVLYGKFKIKAWSRVKSIR